MLRTGEPLGCDPGSIFTMIAFSPHLCYNIPIFIMGRNDLMNIGEVRLRRGEEKELLAGGCWVYDNE